MKKPFVTVQQLEDIAARYPTPFHLYDEQGIRENARRLKAAFSGVPEFREYFAVKALPTPAILRILKDEGCGVDCASMTELMLVRACGFQGRDIMFSANDVPPEEFRLARELNAYINLDDATHVATLRDNGGIPEEVCLRYNPGDAFTVAGEIMGEPKEAKYGMTRAQLSQALRELKAGGAKRFGLHSFLCSNTTDPAYYPALAQLLFETGVELMDRPAPELHQLVRRHRHSLSARRAGGGYRGHWRGRGPGI